MPVYSVQPLRDKFAIVQVMEASAENIFKQRSYVKDKHGRIRLFPTTLAAEEAIRKLKGE